MRKIIPLLILFFTCHCLSLSAQGYEQLWKEYDKAEMADQPQSALSVLKKIRSKAMKEKDYNQVMASMLREIQMAADISTDSIESAWMRLDDMRLDKATDIVRQLVKYHNGRGPKLKVREMMAEPEMRKLLMAKNGADKQRPVIAKGKDSYFFGDDLLSVICMEQDEDSLLAEYYGADNQAVAYMKARRQIDREWDNTRKLQLIDQAIARWPQWNVANELRNRRYSMTNPSLDFSLSGYPMDMERKMFFSNVRNMESVDVSLTRLDAQKKPCEKTKSYQRTFPSNSEWQTMRDTLPLGHLAPGIYAVEVKPRMSARANFVKSIRTYRDTLRITNLQVMSLRHPLDYQRYVVVNALSGQPVAGATLHICNSRGVERQKYTTDSKGECLVKVKSDNDMFYATTADDYAANYTHVYSWYSYNPNDDVRDRTFIYTDRAIYRPGQKIHVAVVRSMVENGVKSSVIADERNEIVLRDHNYKEFGRAMLTTDEWGTASAEFDIPEGITNGSCRITFADASKSIRIEEYVRPTFDVSIDRPESEYAVGDTVLVHGVAKAYSGASVSNAKVSVKVVRRSAWWCCRWYGFEPESEKVLLEDTVETDENGNFTLRMPMIMPKEVNHPSIGRFYSIEAEANVTSLAGESHSATLSLPLSNRSTVLHADIKDKYLADKPVEIIINRYNAGGKEIEGDVMYSIDGKEAWVKANTKFALPGNLASGRHQLMACCGSDTISHSFVLFRTTDTRPADSTEHWFYQTAEAFPENGGEVKIQLGSISHDVHVAYSIFSAEKVIESGTLKLDSSIVTRSFTYKPEWGDGIYFSYAWVKNGSMVTGHSQIGRPMPSSKLKLQWATFRNKLLPGQNEEWTLTVKDNDGKPAKAQLMATLYDKSLDAIIGHSYSMYDYRRLALPSSAWNTHSFQYMHGYLSAIYTKLDAKPLEFSHVDDSYLSVWPDIRTYRRNKAMPLMVMAEGATSIKHFDVMGNDEDGVVLKAKEVVRSTADAEDVQESAGMTPEGNTSSDATQMRSNFAETAFFMPQLATDAAGNATLRFTLPESVTTWRFIALAHDKAMRSGILTDEAVAQKPLMVQPNMPRFLRMGDSGNVVVSVTNLTDKPFDATVSLTILDAATEAPIDTIYNKVTVNSSATAATSFPLTTSYGKDVICRFFARTDTFSDGEQHLLPVIPDYEELTSTRSYTFFEPTDTTLALADMIPAKVIPADDVRAHVKVTYIDNPAWLMMETLPQLRIPDSENAISLMAALYAHVVSAAVNDQPVSADAAQIVNKLADLQLANGAFSWWKGMTGSPYMTLAVTKIIVRMNALAGRQKFTDRILDKAFAYLRNQVAEDVKYMKKYNKKGRGYLSYFHLDYLYSLALHDDYTKADADARYLLNLVKPNYVKGDMADKAAAAIVFANFGRKKDAAEFIEAIKQHTVYRADIGRYFDSHRTGYSWFDYRIPAQTMAIEAMKTVTPDDRRTIADMQRWLLSSKHTQSWDNPYNAVNAVHAFFGHDKSVLRIAKGDTLLADRDVRTDHDAAVTLHKSSDCESWAAAYMTYKQKVNDVESTSNGISIQRELIKPAELKVGDKVKVRITITADRDYDFVTVRDNRAACLEPVRQLSGYANGCYNIMHDQSAEYYYNCLSKGKHVIETEYYVSRKGTYTSGTASALCTYADEYRGTAGAYTLDVK